MKFDGKAFAREIESRVAVKVSKMVNRPKIVSVLVGDDPASVLYTRLKKEAAERMGVEFEVVRLDLGFKIQDLRDTIVKIGAREYVSGVMVQLPVAGLQGQALQEVLAAIPLEKDIDGLRYPESEVIPPVVKAILLVLGKVELDSRFKIQDSRIVVMGARGSVGSALCSELAKRGITVDQIDSDTSDPARTVLAGDVVISCVGKEGVVTGEMVKQGAVVIDVGAPSGDMTREVYEKASVSIEVPGGVGPVTIACLLQNAVEKY